MTLTREQIIEASTNADNLPSVPTLVIDLETELGKENPSVQAMTRTIEQDPSLSTRILKIANSAFYARTKETNSVKQAMMRMGFEELRRVATAASLMGTYEGFCAGHSDLFWGHSMAVGLATRTIARFSSKQQAKKEVDSAFTAGLLHDLGVMLLYQLYPNEYGDLLDDLLLNGGSVHEIEEDVWGINHGEVGEILGRKWELPESICQVLRYHHDPSGADPEYATIVNLVHMADFVCNDQGYARYGSGFPEGMNDEAWFNLGLSLEQVSEIKDKVKQEGERSAVFVGAFAT